MVTSMRNDSPSMDAWLAEAKQSPLAGKIGMYLTHSGVVRATSRAHVRDGAPDIPVNSLELSCDRKKVAAAVSETERLPGIFYVRCWVNEGVLSVGDDMMRILIGADTRPHAIAALDSLLDTVKKQCVSEKEIF